MAVFPVFSPSPPGMSSTTAPPRKDRMFPRRASNTVSGMVAPSCVIVYPLNCSSIGTGGQSGIVLSPDLLLPTFPAGTARYAAKMSGYDDRSGHQQHLYYWQIICNSLKQAR